jgi:alpha-1,6-mannosyltransferase
MVNAKASIGNTSMGRVPVQDGLLLARSVGLVGAVVLAAAAYLGGAFPDDLAQAENLLCLAAWFVGTALMVTAWWWVADRSAPSLPWVLTTAALWAAPLALAPPLGSRDVYSYACQGAAYVAGLDPYAVGPATQPCPWLDSVSLIWRHSTAPYGPLFLALAGIAVNVAGGHLWFVVAALRLAAVAGVALAAAYLPRLARACGVDEARAAWVGLASPLVGVHLIAGAHNEALMIGFAVVGLYYAVRRRPVIGGFWFGLAVAVKATAGTALPFAVLLVVRPDRSLLRLVTAAGWVALGCAGAYAGITVVTGLGLGWFAVVRHSISVGVGLVLAVVLVTLWWRARGRNAAETMRYAAWALLATTALVPFRQWYWLWPLVVIAAADPVARWPVVVTALVAFDVLPDGSGGLHTVAQLPSVVAVFVGIALAIWEDLRNPVKFAANVGAPPNCSRQNPDTSARQ